MRQTILRSIFCVMWFGLVFWLIGITKDNVLEKESACIKSGGKVMHDIRDQFIGCVK